MRSGPPPAEWGSMLAGQPPAAAPRQPKRSRQCPERRRPSGWDPPQERPGRRLHPRCPASPPPMRSGPPPAAALPWASPARSHAGLALPAALMGAEEEAAQARGSARRLREGGRLPERPRPAWTATPGRRRPRPATPRRAASTRRPRRSAPAPPTPAAGAATPPRPAPGAAGAPAGGGVRPRRYGAAVRSGWALGVLHLNLVALGPRCTPCGLACNPAWDVRDGQPPTSLF